MIPIDVDLGYLCTQRTGSDYCQKPAQWASESWLDHWDGEAYCNHHVQAAVNARRPVKQ